MMTVSYLPLPNAALHARHLLLSLGLAAGGVGGQIVWGMLARVGGLMG